jgi:8-oxo-dGTP pyrophosphatase MutT (NUDIX family)
MPQKANRRSSCEAAQIAALPIRHAADGTAQVLLITSRETRRWIIPKGWPMKGLKDHKAAAKEAEEEAGVVGRILKEPIGSYSYWKRRAAHFELCQVKVYLLQVDGQLPTWREKDQRQLQWFSLREAADRVEEPGLGELIAGLGLQGDSELTGVADHQHP